MPPVTWTRHTFTTRIPDAQCRHCHTPNRVGADYAGLFQHDYSDTFCSPRVNGALRPRLYGLDQHHLAQDIHAQQGLGCIDCHNRMDFMGDGKLYSYEMAVPKRSCTDCHGGFAPKRPVETGNVFESPSGQFVLITKRGRKVHRIPRFSPQSPGHDIPAHARVRCSACHAQWSYQDYGLSVIQEDVIADSKWHGRTARGDPDLEALLVPDIRKRLLHPSLKWQKSQFKVRRSLYRALTADPRPGAP